MSTELGALIPRDEFALRQQRAAEEASRRGLDGLLAWSKCGGTYDSYADVVYLANHYSAFPHIRDRKPYWTARGHAAVVASGDADATLIVDMADYRSDLVVACEVRYSNDVVGAVADVLRERGMATGRVGLSGTEFLSLASYRELTARLPALELVPADDVLDGLRMIKSPAEIAMLRESGRIGAGAFEGMMEAIVPGATEADAVAAAVDVITRAGGALYAALVASGAHDSALVWSAMPGYDAKRPLEEGEIFHVDLYAPICGGYLVDYSRSTVVGGEATPAQREVLEASVAAVEAIIAAIEPGVRAADLAHVGEHFLDREGYRVAEDRAPREAARNELNFPAWGHGFGLTWEPPWIMEGDATPIVPGMCLAIERHVGRPGVGTAAFEQDVVVLESGPEILSTARIRWW